MDAIKTLLDEWWDKIRFRQLDTFERKMEAVSKGLTVLETVKHSVESHVINADEGRILTTRVLREVDQLIGLGASLPVSDDVEKIDHVQLLLQKRDIKMLEAVRRTRRQSRILSKACDETRRKAAPD